MDFSCSSEFKQFFCDEYFKNYIWPDCSISTAKNSDNSSAMVILKSPHFELNSFAQTVYPGKWAPPHAYVISAKDSSAIFDGISIIDEHQWIYQLATGFKESLSSSDIPLYDLLCDSKAWQELLSEANCPMIIAVGILMQKDASNQNNNIS